MKEYGINIALKGGNYIQYFVKEDQLELHTKGILNTIQQARAGDHRSGWIVTEKTGMKETVTAVAMGDEISGFGVFVKDGNTIQPPFGQEEILPKDFLKLQMESLKLSIELQRRHLKALDEGEDWKG